MSVLCIVAAGASDMEKRLEAIEQATLTTQQVTLNMEKIIQAGSERTRQASALSDPELTNLLTSLRCVVLTEGSDVNEGLADLTEFRWEDSKYEQQQQQRYLEHLKNTVRN